MSTFWKRDENFWIVGGEFSSLNFHTLNPDTKMVEGPFIFREDAERRWKELSETYRFKADYRFLILKET